MMLMNNAPRGFHPGLVSGSTPKQPEVPTAVVTFEETSYFMGEVMKGSVTITSPSDYKVSGLFVDIICKQLVTVTTFGSDRIWNENEYLFMGGRELLDATEGPFDIPAGSSTYPFEILVIGNWPTAGGCVVYPGESSEFKFEYEVACRATLLKDPRKEVFNGVYLNVTPTGSSLSLNGTLLGKTTIEILAANNCHLIAGSTVEYTKPFSATKHLDIREPMCGAVEGSMNVTLTTPCVITMDCTEMEVDIEYSNMVGVIWSDVYVYLVEVVSMRADPNVLIPPRKDVIPKAMAHFDMFRGGRVVLPIVGSLREDYISARLTITHEVVVGFHSKTNGGQDYHYRSRMSSPIFVCPPLHSLEVAMENEARVENMEELVEGTDGARRLVVYSPRFYRPVREDVFAAVGGVVGRSKHSSEGSVSDDGSGGGGGGGGGSGSGSEGGEGVTSDDGEGSGEGGEGGSTPRESSSSSESEEVRKKRRRRRRTSSRKGKGEAQPSGSSEES